MDGWKAFEVVLGAFGAVLWWMFRRVIEKQESCVTHDDLQKILDQQDSHYRQLDAGRQRQHDENQGEFKEIKGYLQDTFREVFKKIDANNKEIHELAVEVAEERGARKPRR